MQIELKHIKGGLLEQDYSCKVADFPDIAALVPESGAVYRDPISIHLRFQQTGRMVEVDGRIQATIMLICGRCLCTFERVLTETVSLTYVPGLTAQELAAEHELNKDELGLIMYHDDRLELLAPLQEQLLMALPISAVCSDNCQGLCLECGVNLNIARCNCDRKPFNSKFGVLAQLKGE